MIASGLAWARRAAGGHELKNVRPLAGGMTGAVIALDLPGHATPRLVLKLYRPDPSEPDSAGREACILELLAPTGLTAPSVVAMDREGTDSRWPALLMTRMPGRRRFRPRDLQPWLESLARLAARIHSLAVPEEVLPSYGQWGVDDSLELPSWWTGSPSVWSKAAEVFRGPAPDERHLFIHRDFHPGNVLWKGRRPSATVDWLHGCHGPLSVDVAHCRLNLWLDNGSAAADAWVDAYHAANPDAPPHHPYWDVSDALSWIPDPARDGVRRVRRYQAFVAGAVERV